MEPTLSMNMPHPTRLLIMGCLAASLLATAAPRSLAEPANPNPVPATQRYQVQAAQAAKIAKELQAALPEQFTRDTPSSFDISQTQGPPSLQVIKKSPDASDKPAIIMSATCLTFLNILSHAKAIDNSRSGYLASYTSQIDPQYSQSTPPPLPQTGSQQDWSLDTVNLQASFCNQMIGGLVAIEMAHVYLGHYEEYAEALGATTGRTVHINEVVKEKEWREAVMAGAKNALGCGLGVEGLTVLFETLDAMPERPDWTVQFLPREVNVDKVVKSLRKMEKSFFLVGY